MFRWNMALGPIWDMAKLSKFSLDRNSLRGRGSSGAGSSVPCPPVCHCPLLLWQGQPGSVPWHCPSGAAQAPCRSWCLCSWSPWHGTVHSAQPWLQLHQWHRHLLLSDCPRGGEAHSVCHLVLRNQQQPLNTDTLPRNFCFPCDRDIGVIAGLYFCFYGYEISLGCLWYMNLVWTLGYRFSSAC